MADKQTAPYGSWRSPISAALAASGGARLSEPQLDGMDIYWLESRPQEGGRQAAVRLAANGEVSDVTPPGFNVRTRVHEYGGGAYAVHDGVVYFSNLSDGRLYRQERDSSPVAITPEGPLRYADVVVDAARDRLIAVREDHRTSDREAVNTLVAVPCDGSTDPVVLVEGADFYSNPRLDPDGRRLCWLAWNHPNMPWDGTELLVAELGPDGALGQARHVAGGPSESIYDPKWSPAGELFFVSDRSGWWNLYRVRNEAIEHLAPMDAEFGQPQWNFGSSSYAFTTADQLVCRVVEQGRTRLLALDLDAGALTPFAVRFTAIGHYLRAAGPLVVFDGGAPTEPQAILRLDVRSGAVDVLRESRHLDLDPAGIAVPESIAFPTEGGRTAYGLFYPPANTDYQAPAGELPPLIVHVHGGPTSQATALLNLTVQFWTSRGFAYLDVNYGGSTGFGRAYRERLDGQWGVVDVDDSVNGARYLVEQGKVDGARLAIAGGSAGGYTTLCAVAFRDAFKAGASHFGIADLETFVRDTHKYESRYLDRLVGPYPAQRDRYRERSAINALDRIACPVILLQGLDDKIVPPNQAEDMVAALRARGLPVAYVAFAGEGHGFRQAANIQRALEAELSFYAQVFGFTLPDPIEPVEVANLTRAC